ncbi:vegetative incompatibility het-e-1 [Fusarium longipes]|uniref:Vegetative incompatibility het-e-1 n=1 Tax=Fusarium longipes TaxID=694270 RepID=A0A395RMG5_9HYPO|nr:vegetative incompatibility het-e-1 [Fusarium longipes]
MDNITEKIARVTDLSAYTDLTPEQLKKLFHEIGGSPEKLRTILNLWFVPNFKPTFIEPQHHVSHGLHDVGYPDSPDIEQAQRPLRLIDLQTGNLVDVWNTSPLDSYCMLSHRWKGDEITLAHIKRAREKHFERSKNGSPDELDGDIHIVLEQARLDILEQEEIIVSLLRDNPEGRTVRDLLEAKINASDTKAQFNWARQNRDLKKSNAERCKMEKDMFDHLISRIQQNISDDKQESTSSSPATSPVVEEAEREYADAQKILKVSIENQNKANNDAEFLHRDRRLSDATDEMISRIQRWKSAIKLDRSISHARDIFQSRPFPNRGASYIWSDTCCIDKLNYGELSQSLSLMGDWYANAEFCLVHLDTDSKAADAIRDWNLFKGETDPQQPNIASFKTIEGTIPEWSNRAWTLQELVMSKMVFFTNSQWKLLSRPVESLGYVYPLVPYIELYTAGEISSIYSKAMTDEVKTTTLSEIRNSQALESLLDNHYVISASEEDDQSAVESAKLAMRLILILQTMGFEFPTELTVETAVPEMNRSVYLASWNLGKDGDEESNAVKKEVFRELKNITVSLPKSESVTEEAEAQGMINFLLVSLVEATRHLITSDRKSIAEFGQVNQLESWKQGTSRSGFAAEQVLQLSCRRKATVAVDHVYSLMGILGVRFQSFHAEGYAKALSRLLDEVVISCNDVSIFNWTGVSMGSPVRGRSMYPASHKAYGNEKDHGRRYNMMISADVQKKRKEVMFTYQAILTLLRDTIDCIKAKGRDGLPLEWASMICAFIRNSPYEDLHPELKNIGKILHYIRHHCNKPSPAQQSTQPKELAETSTSPVPDVKAASGWGFNKPSLSKMKVQSPLETPKLRGFGIGKPSLGRHQSEPVKKDINPEPVSPGPQNLSKPQLPEWQSLDGEVKEYLKSLSSQDPDVKARCPLPSRIQELDIKSFEPDATTEHRDGEADISLGDDLTCPNPIIVNSSGIEGIFDIQRVIVTMIDREKLVRQVARASSPKQKISGWCIISTGFASVVVNFACEQHILKKQLDVEQAVEDRIVKEDRATKLYKDLDIKMTTKSKEKDEPLPEKDQPNDTADENDKGTAYSWKPTKEEQTIVRLINFIQEPNLQLVAGEWVLARFSGARRANWFLCYLELGSTHSFYGHRIAASDIDFTNSAIEPGLMKAWKVYMTRKKRKMCNVLNKYIGSASSASKGLESLNKSSQIANENYARLVDAKAQNLDRVMSIGSAFTSPSMLKLPFQEQTAKQVDAAEDVDSDDEDSGPGLFGDLLDQGKEAATALSEYTYLAVYERICEMQAKHLDKHLATSVLKRTPKSLQTAVEGVDEDKGFLPAMFHSSKRVHMF